MKCVVTRGSAMPAIRKEDKAVKCACCGVNMNHNGETLTGARFCVEDDRDEPHPEYKRLKEKFDKTEFEICVVCSISKFGVPEARGIGSMSR